ncbi:MAG: SocA family protein [Spirochaetia bacterium]|jgi:uncharacterized phage-associated protein|nr:SocA family protein [Spirochaetia bacterium]
MKSSSNTKTVIEAAAYLQRLTSETNYMKLIKLLYFADRYHLRHYCFLFTEDDYRAMKLGPVGSQTKDILTLNDFYIYNLSEEEQQTIKDSVSLVGQYKIKVKSDSTRNLSKSAIEALDFSVSNFGEFDTFLLSDITHDYPEWHRYAKDFAARTVNSIEIHPEDMFDNPATDAPYIAKYLKGLDPFKDDTVFLKSMKQIYLYGDIA